MKLIYTKPRTVSNTITSWNAFNSNTCSSRKVKIETTKGNAQKVIQVKRLQKWWKQILLVSNGIELKVVGKLKLLMSRYMLRIYTSVLSICHCEQEGISGQSHRNSLMVFIPWTLKVHNTHISFNWTKFVCCSTQQRIWSIFSQTVFPVNSEQYFHFFLFKAGASPYIVRRDEEEKEISEKQKFKIHIDCRVVLLCRLQKWTSGCMST